jgi:hypothetical protein
VTRHPQANASLDRRVQAAFLALVLAQAAHSIEEYVFRLYDVFQPARWVSGLVSEDVRAGFAILNVSIVALGLLCYFYRIRPGHPSARGWVWFWVTVELVNGIGHPFLALVRRAYLPGVVTAPILFAVALYLAFRLVDESPSGDP